ncbi:MAG: FMN-binding protein [Rhodothermaceae bacterium]
MKYPFLIITLYTLCTLPVTGQSLKNKAEVEIVEQFNEYVTLSFEKFVIPDSVKKEITSEYNQKFFRNEVYHWEIFYGDSVIAHAFLDNVLGRTQPITFLAVIDQKGEMIYNSVIKYRSHKGGAVQNRNWLDQFIGKNFGSKMRVGSDIQAISGATYSVRSLTKGFGKILALYEKIFRLVR